MNKSSFGTAALLVFGLLAVPSTACNSLQNAQANDPQRCERDPKCTGKGKISDCYEQCNDSPDCTDRCREMNTASGQTEAR